MADASPPGDGKPPATVLSNPQDDADRIRLKRLAKLQAAASAPSSSSSTPSSSNPPTPSSARATPQPKPEPKLPVKRVAVSATSTNEPAIKPPPAKKVTTAPVALNLPQWEAETITRVFNVTLDRARAEARSWEVVWLKDLATELQSENPDGNTIPPLSADIVDRLLIARLELDPNAMSDDPEMLTVIAALPSEQTIFEYLVGCWQRINASRSTLHRKATSYTEDSLAKAYAVLDQLRDLVISYAGLTLQDPTMFPQPQTTKVLGAHELALPLLALSSSTPLSSSTVSTLAAHEVEPFLADLTRRFDEETDLESTFGEGVVLQIMAVISADTSGLVSTMSGTSGWRAGVGALEAMVAIKSLAAMLTRLPIWNDSRATGPTIEQITLLGPIARLGVFAREWPAIAQAYFSDPQKRTREDVDSSNATLRNTLRNLQKSLHNIINAAVRAGPAPRDAVLDYFARALQLNLKRGGTHVDPATVASDGFMVNLQTSLLRFAEPFLDAKFSKLDRVDPLYYAHSSRLDVSEETRLLADASQAKEFVAAHENDGAPTPNFITEIFFLLAAYNHYGLVRTITAHDAAVRRVDDVERRLEQLQADTSYQGTPQQAQMEMMVQRMKDARSRVHSEIFAYQVQLLDQDLIDRTIAYTTFSMAWLIRLIDPAKAYPAQSITLPLSREVPEVFKMLPEYFVEDIIEFYLFIVRHHPQSLELNGKKELLEFILIFISSTWYIKNPYLKAKLVQILFYGTLSYRGGSTGVLGPLLNSHPLSLKHLMPSLMSFYVDVEQTGASSQFYDKFEARRNIANIFKVIWDNPDHRAALSVEAGELDRFVRFANLLMNDATFLLDESLSKLTEISTIQKEIKNQEAWNARTPDERREREEHLHTLEGHAASYTTLGKSTVGLLKTFTAEAKAPWMSPELVDRLAAMLNYNLDALAGPKAQNLKVEHAERYRFEPRQLLSDILQVYLNLSDQHEFISAIAGEGRSYRKELFERAAGIARKFGLKSEDEIEQLRLFIVKVEETKALLDVEDDLGEIPDEYLDPILYTVMRDPVTLPTSGTVIDRSSIKAHLLSDAKDPFNRMPLKLGDVIPNPELKAKIEAFLIERRMPKSVTDAPSVTIENDPKDVNNSLMDVDGAQQG